MKYLDAAQKFFLAFLMLFTTLLLFTNVVLRYFFHSAIFWAEEVLRYCIVWITFIGASMCVKEKSHIGIDVLMELLRPAGKRILEICLHIAGIAFASVLLILSLRFVGQIQITGQISATIGSIPMYIIYLCFPVGFVLYFIRSAEALIRLIRNAGKGETVV